MTENTVSRRSFLHDVTRAAVVGAFAVPALTTASREASASPAQPLFKISLAHWSYHKAIFGDSRQDYAWFSRTLHSDPDGVLLGPMDPRDIVVKAREHGIDAVDYANQLFFGHASDRPYLTELKNRADGEGVKSLMITCDELGRIGDADPAARLETVEKHVEWAEAAAFLGCHSIRVNAHGDGTYLEQMQRVADGVHTLCERADRMGMNILVENHGFASSNGAWLAMVVESVDHPRLGVLADFNNFFMGGWGVQPERWYDRYQGLRDLAPYTRAVSAKAIGFDEDGQELQTDYVEAMRILLKGGFRGYAGVEYEGDHLSEDEGVAATKRLLEAAREALAAEFE
jgi:sugar phosphate isomerase/epimerase